MKSTFPARRLRPLLVAALAVLPLWALAPRPAASNTAEVARVIVKYRANGALSRETIAAAGGQRGAADRPQHAKRMGQRLGVALRDGLVVMPRVQVLHARGLSSAALAARLAADPDVEYAEVDQRARISAVPNDPLFAAAATGVRPNGPDSGQWYLRAPDASIPAAINAQAAWDFSLGAGVVVAVLDTGVRLAHPDLAGKLLPGHDFIAADPDGAFDTAADGDGRDADPTDPGDWVRAGQCGSGEGAANSSWHGTQVSGLIAAATNNGWGMAGAGYNARVLPVRVLGKCGGYQSDIVAGMRWAAGLSSDPVPNPNPARVVNLSLGSSGNCSTTYQSAVSELTNAGVAVVAAAGNEIGVPAIQPANCNGAIGVAGIRHIGTKVGYSNLGNGNLTVAAPAGNCVNIGAGQPCLFPLATTTNTGTQAAASDDFSDSFDISVGTSFASPLVAGAVALMVAAHPALSVAQIRSTLQSTARPFPTTGSGPDTPQCQAPSAGFEQDECYCTASTCGAGMLDARAAVAQVAAAAVPQARIADVGLSPAVGASLVLDGRASSAVGLKFINSYAWAITAGTSAASVVGGSNADQVSLSLNAVGPVTVQLTVTDSAGASASTSQTFVVAGPPTARTMVSPGAPSAGATVTLDAATSTAQGNRSIVAWRWSVSAGSAGAVLAGSATGATATVSTASAGSFEVQLTVTDNAGASHTSSTSVNVAAAPTGGGGGALGWPWLLGLALAAAVLRRPRTT